MASENDTDVPNVFGYCGRHLLSEYNNLYQDVLPDVEPSDFMPMLGYPHLSDPALSQHTGFPAQLPLGSPTKFPWTEVYPVCIIGAGAAGLYTAMILESLGIRYQIIEANSQGRVGGRLFTHHFPDGGPYDYFEVGAMRFPRTPFMKRTFDLIERRGLKDPDSRGPKPHPLKLIRYIRNADNTWLLFNGTRIGNRDTSSQDPFGVKNFIKDGNLATPKAASEKVADVLRPFRDMFKPRPGERTRDIAESIKQLFNETNPYSMRGYMLLIRQMAPRDVNWCETIMSNTGQYDRSLAHIVLDDVATDWPGEPSSDKEHLWWCIDGGTSKLPRAMLKSLHQTYRKRMFEYLPEELPKEIFETLPIAIPEDKLESKTLPKTLLDFLPGYAKDTALYKSTVTSISRGFVRVRGWIPQVLMKVAIKIGPNKDVVMPYSAVISTIPLPRLGLVDLSGANIHKNYTQWSAIRQLQFSPAFKIGIKFTTPWWETNPDLKIHGGQSSTDLPSRTVVYPSYPAGAKPEDMSKVLIVSYCKTYDAQRFGGLIHRDGKADPELIDQVFSDLAALHGVTVAWLKQYYTEGDYFAWDWSQDPFALGGFGFFSPGACEDDGVYGSLLQPAAGGKLFFAGEGISTAHGWVAGALDSAWRAVDQYLTASGQIKLRELFHEKWGATEYWDESPANKFGWEYRKLLERHLVISLGKDGFVPENLKSVPVPPV